MISTTKRRVPLAQCDRLTRQIECQPARDALLQCGNSAMLMGAIGGSMSAGTY